MKTTNNIKFKKISNGNYKAIYGNLIVMIEKQWIEKQWNLSAYDSVTFESVLETSCDKKSHCIEYAQNAL